MRDELTVTRGTYSHTGPTYPDTVRDPSSFAPDPAFRLEAVVDHTHARGFFPWQSRWWREGEFLITLRPDLDDPTWGLVMTELFAHLGDDEDHTGPAVLRRALEKHQHATATGAAPALTLFPGLQFRGSDSLIVSGCCGQLNGWWRVATFEHNLGHDPDVTITTAGDIVLVRSAMHVDGPGSDLVDEPEYIATTRDHLAAEIARLQSELAAVAARVESWAATLTADPTFAHELALAFHHEFVG